MPVNKNSEDCVCAERTRLQQVQTNTAAMTRINDSDLLGSARTARRFLGATKNSAECPPFAEGTPLVKGNSVQLLAVFMNKNA